MEEAQIDSNNNNSNSNNIINNTNATNAHNRHIFAPETSFSSATSTPAMLFESTTEVVVAIVEEETTEETSHEEITEHPFRTHIGQPGRSQRTVPRVVRHNRNNRHNHRNRHHRHDDHDELGGAVIVPRPFDWILDLLVNDRSVITGDYYYFRVSSHIGSSSDHGSHFRSFAVPLVQLCYLAICSVVLLLGSAIAITLILTAVVALTVIRALTDWMPSNSLAMSAAFYFSTMLPRKKLPFWLLLYCFFFVFVCLWRRIDSHALSSSKALGSATIKPSTLTTSATSNTKILADSESPINSTHSLVDENNNEFVNSPTDEHHQNGEAYILLNSDGEEYEPDPSAEATEYELGEIEFVPDCGSGCSSSGGIVSTLAAIHAANRDLPVRKRVPHLNQTMEVIDHLVNLTAAVIRSELTPERIGKIMEFFYTVNVSDRCFLSLTKVARGMLQQQIWALKFLDAFGKIPTGIMEGSISHFGEFDECLEIADPEAVAALKEDSEDSSGGSNGVGIRGQYCLAKFILPYPSADTGGPYTDEVPLYGRHHYRYMVEFLREYNLDNYLTLGKFVELLNNQKGASLRLGVCFPSGCSAAEFEGLLNQVMYPVTRMPVELEPDCFNPESVHRYNGFELASIIIIGSILSINVLCTFVDAVFWYSRDDDDDDDDQDDDDDDEDDEPSEAEINRSELSRTSSSSSTDTDTTDSSCPPKQPRPQHLMHRLRIPQAIRCFSLIHNTKALFELHEVRNRNRKNHTNRRPSPPKPQRVQKIPDITKTPDQLSQIVVVGVGQNITEESENRKLCHCKHIGSLFGQNTSKTTNTAARVRRFAFLDTIRLILVLNVCVDHMFLFTPFMAFMAFKRILNSVITKVYYYNKYFFARNILIIDTLFIISGLVLSYSLLRRLTLTRGRLQYGVFLVRLWLKYSLPMAAVIAIYWILPLTGDGPIWRTGMRLLMPACRDAASLASSFGYYSNYRIKSDQNVFHFDPQFALCNPPTWFLSALFQLQLLGPLFVYLIYRNARYGLLVCASLVALGCYASISPNHLFGQRTIFDGLTISSLEEMVKAFVAFHMGINQYIVSFFTGIVVGYLVTEQLIHRRFNPSKRTETLLWLISLVSLTGVMFWFNTLHRINAPAPRLSILLWFSVGKLIACLAIGWMLYALCVGRAVFVERLLSVGLFRVLSRLSFGIYLLHFIPLTHRLFTVRDTYVMTDKLLFEYILVDFVQTTFLAAIFHVTVERPFNSLVSLMFSRNEFEEIFGKTGKTRRSTSDIDRRLSSSSVDEEEEDHCSRSTSTEVSDTHNNHHHHNYPQHKESAIFTISGGGDKEQAAISTPPPPLTTRCHHHSDQHHHHSHHHHGMNARQLQCSLPSVNLYAANCHEVYLVSPK